ncbi:MAG TPA: DM13 domain-containing protein [Acidimicrobiales bacterium]|nr:DM13 domain-containing protein [Acidimicrobiales bacterium]
MTAVGRRGVCALLALGTLLVTGCGNDDESAAPAPTEPASTVPFPTALTVPRSLTEGETQRASPRWEQVRVVTGNEPATIGPFAISTDAIQWRVKWSCESGTIRILATPPPSRPGPLVDSPCPERGEGYGRQTGDITLDVQASGPWKATVEQQVDTPLDEPPLPEMAGAQVLGRGEFYNVEKTGKGTAILYRLPDGRRALRFEPGFEVFNDPDLVVWLSEATNPRTSKEVVDSDHVEIAALRATKGSQNYILPDNLPLDRIGSVALYCVPVPSIYTAASLAS